MRKSELLLKEIISRLPILDVAGEDNPQYDESFLKVQKYLDDWLKEMGDDILLIGAMADLGGRYGMKFDRKATVEKYLNHIE